MIRAHGLIAEGALREFVVDSRMSLGTKENVFGANSTAGDFFQDTSPGRS
jgi:hypothetical protein